MKPRRPAPGRAGRVQTRLRRLVGVALLAVGCAARPRPSPTPPTTPPVVAAPEPAPRRLVRETPSAAFTDPARRQKIAATLPAVRDEARRVLEVDRLVGLAVGVVVDGELVFAEGFGARDVDYGGEVDARTAFRIGSITKVFTAMTALRLAQAGRIDLDAPAADLLPELHTIVYPTGDARRLSVRDLLTHTAGLPRNPHFERATGRGGPTRADLMRAIDGLSLTRPPGIAYEYSNLGFALLGQLVAAVDGRPHHDAIRGAILGPLGMRDTVWEREEVAADRLAFGHVVRDGEVVARPPPRHGAIDAAGGLFSTVEDLARVVAFQLAAWPPRGGDDDAPLARANTRDAHGLRAFNSFRARTRPPELAASGVEGGVAGVGLGWSVSHGCELAHVVGHNGAVDGYHATVRMLPHGGVGVIVLANAAWADTDELAASLLRILGRGGGLKPRAPRALPELTVAAGRVVGLLARWDEAAFKELVVASLRDGGAAARSGERLRWFGAALGGCNLGPLRRTTSAWSGVFRLECERGSAELTLTLTSARDPKIAEIALAWQGGTPTPTVERAAAEAAALLGQFDAGRFAALFSPAFTRSAMDRLAAQLRFEHGTCRPGRALEVTGPDSAAFALECDRGAAKLTIALDRAEPARVTTLQVAATGSQPACR